MYLENSKIIIIKIGSSILIDEKRKIRKKWIAKFAKDVQELIRKDKKVIIVSSGAIAMGCKKLNINKRISLSYYFNYMIYGRVSRI